MRNIFKSKKKRTKCISRDVENSTSIHTYYPKLTGMATPVRIPHLAILHFIHPDRVTRPIKELIRRSLD